MLMLRAPYLKVLGAFAILFAILSAGFMVAEQCHIQSPLSTLSVTHSHGNDLQTGGQPHSLLSDICTGAFFLVLILGAKNLVNRALDRGYFKTSYLFERVLKFLRPPNLTFTLSRPQLGTYRI